jgi:hypothetical protein
LGHHLNHEHAFKTGEREEELLRTRSILKCEHTERYQRAEGQGSDA